MAQDLGAANVIAPDAEMEETEEDIVNTGNGTDTTNHM